MNWLQVPVYLGPVLGVAVIIRLLRLRLHRVYQVFCAFLAVEVVAGAVIWMSAALRLQYDYRVIWFALAPFSWVFTLLTVYALLGAILDQLPGVLSFSQFLLKISFFVAGGIGAAVAIQVTRGGPAVHGLWMKAVLFAVGMERAVSLIAVLVLLGIEAFVLWFPVRMARNLFVFSAGLTVYFLLRAVSVLGLGVLSHQQETLLSNITMSALTLCYVYWLATITARGELTEVQIGHSWSSEAQESALRELERMNTILLRSVEH